MSDTKNSTTKSKISPKPIKAQIGRVGLYGGRIAVVKTTRCFFFDKQNNKQIRGLELWMNVTADERLNFLSSGRAWLSEQEPNKTYVFISIVDFRKNFVYNDVVDMIYATN